MLSQDDISLSGMSKMLIIWKDRKKGNLQVLSLNSVGVIWEVVYVTSSLIKTPLKSMKRFPLTFLECAVREKASYITRFNK